MREYLERRDSEANSSNCFSVVIDLLHSCELCCVGCGTSAKHVVLDKNILLDEGLSLDRLEIICRKIKDYSAETNCPVSIVFGGGEPFLKSNIMDVIRLFHSYFGKGSLGIDTNAALDNSYEKISEALRFMSYVGISLNGNREYHDWWSGVSSFSAYDKTFDTIKRLCANPQFADRIEVTSVATKKNFMHLPALMTELSRAGVKNYSVHRSIPVGRMSRNMSLVPDWEEYLRLLIYLIKESKKNGVKFHLHHSIENIHKAILLGENTFANKCYGDPNKASSIGISPEGTVVFNPWCMAGYWKKLNCGNILDEGVSLKEQLGRTDTPFSKAVRMSAADNRCSSCRISCAGGSRIAAVATSIAEAKIIDPDADEIIGRFSSADPACPLYGKRGDS